jgi:hypothetical protein
VSLTVTVADGEPALGQRWRARWGTREIVLVARSFRGDGWAYVTVRRERRKGHRYMDAARRSRGGYSIGSDGLRKRYRLVDEDAAVVAARVAKLQRASTRAS